MASEMVASKPEVAATPVSRKPALALVLLSLGTTGLAIFQWIELVLVRRGGSAICTVNETINCETVWNSRLAERIHHLLGVPVAALGLVWGLTALVQSVRLWLLASRGQSVRPAVSPLRLVGIAGMLSCVYFAYASAQAHALCLTCLGTYLLVTAFALTAFIALPKPVGAQPGEAIPAVAWPLATSIVFFLLALIPGRMTPSANSAESLPTAPAAGQSTGTNSTDAALTAYLNTLSAQDKMQLGVAIETWRNSWPVPEALQFPPRRVVGDPRAPVHFIDFTDVKCPHCRHLEETLKQMRTSLPPGRFTVESRYFPLDPECSPNVTVGMPLSPRCVGAKAQICLEKAVDLPDVQERILAEQESLTSERVLQIASGSMPRPALEACIASEETARKLQEDIKLADVYGLRGTPLVVVNGRSAGSPLPSFLYVMALTGADINNPAFASLMRSPAP